MEHSPRDDTQELLAHVLLPVAHEDDAVTTATALKPYAPERVTALYVVEKGEGVVDKTSVAHSEEVAEESYTAVKTVFPDAELHTAYARDIVGSILDAADEVNASAIAYQPRGGSRLTQFLSGDLSLKLITNADRPVIVLPETDTDE